MSTGPASEGLQARFKAEHEERLRKARELEVPLTPIPPNPVAADLRVRAQQVAIAADAEAMALEVYPDEDLKARAQAMGIKVLPMWDRATLIAKLLGRF